MEDLLALLSAQLGNQTANHEDNDASQQSSEPLQPGQTLPNLGALEEGRESDLRPTPFARSCSSLMCPIKQPCGTRAARIELTGGIKQGEGPPS